MAHFFLKLLPPRPSFPMDMSEEERGLMLQHLSYMDDLFARGKVLLFGPVMDPAGAHGIGVFEAADAAEAEALISSDPSVLAGLNTFVLHPMRIGGAQASPAS